MVWGEGRGSCFLPVSLGLWYGERGRGVVSYLLVLGYGIGRGEGELFLTCRSRVRVWGGGKSGGVFSYLSLLG